MFSNDAKIEEKDTDLLTLHPVVFLFPELRDKEFSKLTDSIAAMGQIDPVWITSDNQIFDGRHRWQAQKKLGNKVLCRTLKDTDTELLTTIIDRVIAQNLGRRHMTKSQRAIVAAAMEEKRIKAEVGQTQGELDLCGGAAFSWTTFDELLETFDVTKAAYRDARQLLKHGEPETIKAVESGRINMLEAMNTVRQRIKLTREAEMECLDK